MKQLQRRLATGSALAAALGLLNLAVVVAAPLPGADQPIVVELFTSQGCSSCPPANDALAALADRADVLALSFGVTYWDALGWKDSFASAKFTQRQWDYAHGLGRANVATPQVVVDGQADTPGISLSQIEPLIAAARARRGAGPLVTLADGKVLLATAAKPATPATVWLVRYDPRILQVPVRAGENSGKTLPHRDVVRELTRIGTWRGAAQTLTLPAGRDKTLSEAILVQAGTGGPIIAAAKLL